MRRSLLIREFDIAIVGSGFAGSLLAMIARKLGRSVVLLEKGRHPRFAIGESSTPLANLLLEELAVRYDLPRLLPLCKWGSWQDTYPEIACGLKRGFTFYHHRAGRRFTPDPMRERQLLVGASPHAAIADTHWYRPDFDHFLLREAQALGAEYLDEIALAEFSPGPGGGVLTGTRQGRPVSIQAGFVVDATGPRGFLHQALGLPEVGFPHLPSTQGLYAHFTGVGCVGDLEGIPGEGSPPFPVDEAALHHVFDGGWIWVLRFNNGLTSAGVAARDPLAEELGFSEGAPAWDRLLSRFPGVAAQFAGAVLQTGFVHAPRLSFRSGTVAGPGFALMPSAAGFVDPLLSTGFPLALLGIARLGAALAEDWGSPRFAGRMEAYAAETAAELAAAERLVSALYANMADFEVFAALTRLYFAAVSYTETARRLGRPERAGSFLLDRHPGFGGKARDCLERARVPMDFPAKARLLADIAMVIEPFDVAGLGDPARRNWHPVMEEDLYRAAPKLGATREDIAGLLERCGFAAPALRVPASHEPDISRVSPVQ